ncbi:MAG: LamG-like jellyroll fold domain-containing protein [Planctomycetota bacterium]
MAAYYLLLDRKEQIERLKDEDPVEAIKILEMVLRDGADDYQEHAVELIKDLRQKQSRVGSLIAEAEKATASAAPKQAIKSWQKILEIIPRHKLAVGQVQKLESLLEDFRQRWEKAIRLMNEAKFHDADNILQSCVKDIPARNDIRGMLDTCRSRSQKYRDAFDHAETAMRGKLIQKADEQISEALSQAPDSEEALAIAAELSKKLEKTEKMIDQAYRELSRAHFSKVGEKITEIEQLQADNPKTKEIAKELRKIQKEYSKYLKAAVEAETSFVLGKALEKAILAQNECPDSKEISDVITSIKGKQFAANAHLEEAKTALEEARFEEVEQHAKKAKELWSELDIKAYSESVIQSATIEYRSKIDEAQHLFNKHDFKKALAACEKALQICPKAAKAGWLKDRINDVIKKKEKRSAQIIGIILLIKNITLAALLGILIVALTPLAFLADKLCSRIFKKTRIRYYRWPEALWSCWSRQKDNIWESKALSPQIDDILAESLIHEAPPEIKAERQIFIKRLKQKLLTRKTAMWIIVLLGVVFIFRSGCDNRRHIRQAQGYLVNQKFDQARMELSECGWFCASGKAKLWNMLYDAENENRQIKASSSNTVKYQSKKANATAWKSNSGTLSDGLIHYYSCEESTNKRGLVDIVSGKNSSLMWGSPKVKRKGIKNYGWAFNGNDAIAWSDTLLPDLAAGDDFTLSIWAYNTGLSNSNDSIWSTYYTKGSKAYFLLDIYKSKLRFIGTNMGFKNNSQTNILSISSNQWYHYVLRKKGSLYTIFVNGTSISYATGNSTVTWDKDKRRRFIIGSQNSASPGKYWWNGYFDEFGVWARSLSDEEVSKLYNRGNGLSYNQIVGAD